MTLEIAALGLNAIISMIVPVVIFIVILVKSKDKRLPLCLLFVAGGSIYMAMEWGAKEHGLTWLFNHTDFAKFMNQHYIPYLLLVALAGAVLLMMPVILITLCFKRQMDFVHIVVLGLGYTMTESVMLMGYRSVNTIIELVKGTDMELNSTTTELFLSCYERILMAVIQIAVFVVLVYFINHKMTVRGGILAVFCHTMAAFLPGFFIAFSLDNYFEVYDRTIALILVYVVMTAMALASVVMLYSFRYILKEK